MIQGILHAHTIAQIVCSQPILRSSTHMCSYIFLIFFIEPFLIVKPVHNNVYECLFSFCMFFPLFLLFSIWNPCTLKYIIIIDIFFQFSTFYCTFLIILNVICLSNRVQYLHILFLSRL